MEADPSVDSRRRWAFKVRLSTALIGVAAAAIWLAYFASRIEHSRLSAKLPPLRDVARELRFGEAGLLSVYRLPTSSPAPVFRLSPGGSAPQLLNRATPQFLNRATPQLPNRAAWQLHVPLQPRYELCLATRGIGRDGTASQFESTILPPGQHALEIKHRDSQRGPAAPPMPGGSAATASLGSYSIIEIDETADWYPQAGSTIVDNVDVVEGHLPEQPLILYRVRFHETGAAQPPVGPADGILLWIQPL